MGDLNINQIIGRYRILREIKKGGMGEIYLAEHIHTERRVAIKTIRKNILEDFDPKEIEERFKREAYCASQISHKNVVQIYDFEFAKDKIPAYIAMEFVDGTPLSELLAKKEKFTPERAIDLITQILSGIGAAHEKGIIHRDLKPANIMLCAGEEQGSEEVKVVDFGIAKILDADLTKLTKLGQPLGTFEYMSPEQFNLEEDVDSRADVYAIGLILYQMLAGEMPFHGTTIQNWAICHTVTLPKPLPDSIPLDISKLILQSLEKNRELRPGSAVELKEMLLEARTNLQNSLVTLVPFRVNRSRRYLTLDSSVVTALSCDDKEARSLAFGFISLLIVNEFFKRIVEFRITGAQECFTVVIDKNEIWLLYNSFWPADLEAFGEKSFIIFYMDNRDFDLGRSFDPSGDSLVQQVLDPHNGERFAVVHWHNIDLDILRELTGVQIVANGYDAEFNGGFQLKEMIHFLTSQS